MIDGYGKYQKLNLLFLLCLCGLPHSLFMQTCPPADTVVVSPPQDLWNIPYTNNWNGIEVMTWNIKEFPLIANTANYVNEIISDMLPDIICIQEIMDETSYNSLADALPAYNFIKTDYGGGGYIDLGIAVRNDCAESSANRGWRYPRIRTGSTR